MDWKNINEEQIHVLGVWIFRLTLVIGAVVAGCLGKENVAQGCIAGLVISFFFF